MPGDNHAMLTVLLHHDQAKTLDEIMAHLRETGFYRDFPPEGSELVSWVVAMSFATWSRRRGAPSATRCFPPTTSRRSPLTSRRSIPSFTSGTMNP